MRNSFLILVGKAIIWFSKATNRGNGSTWPGHIALTVNKRFVSELKNQNAKLKIVLVVGTNGKTTTSKLIRTILGKNGSRVIHNESGANLINGVASALLQNANLFGKINAQYAIFEIDENSLPGTLQQLTPNYVVVLNLFRDQLDRYGEVNTVARKWDKALDSLPETTTILLNADDPQIAYFAKGFTAKVKYFGLTDADAPKEKTHQVVDSTYCPNCGHKLTYHAVFFSHLGIWECESCNRKRPHPDVDDFDVYPLSGLYNKYNTHAAVLLGKLEGVNTKQIEEALTNFDAAFGRQETLTVSGKSVQIFLSKNPTSFNESLRTVKELGGKHILLVLNDRIPDGRDVSWIWDTALEEFINDFQSVTVSGDRAYDMGLRIKYALDEFPISNFKFQINDQLSSAIKEALEKTPKNETLFIVPTYSAMLEVRKILTGKKIL